MSCAKRVQHILNAPLSCIISNGCDEPAARMTCVKDRCTPIWLTLCPIHYARVKAANPECAFKIGQLLIEETISAETFEPN